MKKFSGFDYVMVDSRLSDDEKMVRDTIRSFIEEEALPKFMEHYEKGTFPSELVQPLAELGEFSEPTQGTRCGISLRQGITPRCRRRLRSLPWHRQSRARP